MTDDSQKSTKSTKSMALMAVSVAFLLFCLWIIFIAMTTEHSKVKPEPVRPAVVETPKPTQTIPKNYYPERDRRRR